MGLIETFWINYPDELTGKRPFENVIGDWHCKVNIYETTDQLNELRGQGDLVDAYMNVKDGHIVMHFSADLIAMALIIHESIHAMFWMYDRECWDAPKRKRRKTINIFNHPEPMVHYGANLATIIYGQVTSKYPVTV